MRRGGMFLVLAIAVVAAGLAYGRLPTPEAVRVVKQSVPDTAAARGRVVYERYGCRMCHGGDGKGGFANPNSETDGKVPAIITFIALSSSARIVKGSRIDVSS